jgi:hypothetical protein
MTRRRAPHLATLLPEHPGRGNDALIGDLAEEYRAGRSALWYRGQVLTAVVVTSCDRIWAHKGRSLKAYAPQGHDVLVDVLTTLPVVATSLAGAMAGGVTFIARHS